MDGTELRVSEVWISDKLRKYSYYWLEETSETIKGWDNAPHHEELDSFPHHVHEENGVTPSEPKNGRTILERLRKEFS